MTCNDCYMRLQRQATEGGKKYKFRLFKRERAMVTVTVCMRRSIDEFSGHVLTSEWSMMRRRQRQR